MESKLISLLNSEKAGRFLENVTDIKSRNELEKAVIKEGVEDIFLARAERGETFHTADGLSPAAGIAVGPDGRIYLSDEFNHRIAVYSPGGRLEKTAGSKGSGNGEFHYPRGLAVDTGGNLYVADAWNHRVVVFNPDLSFKNSFGKLGTGQGELDEPVDLCFAGGLLAVLEKSNHRIHFFHPSGIPTGTIGNRGSVDEQNVFYLSFVSLEVFHTPVFEFPSAITADQSGNLYVADTNNHRVVKIGKERRPDSAYSLLDLKYPSGLACDAIGNLHVTQFNNEYVLVFSPEGIHLYSYKPGVEVPLSIAINGETAYVASGIKPGVARLKLKPQHSIPLCREKRFYYHLKTALSFFKEGRWQDAVNQLVKAEKCPEKPSPEELGAMLPENDFSFAELEGEIEEIQTAKPFMNLLAEYAGTLLEELEKAITDKISAIDELSEISLKLEKSFLSSAESNDDLMVARYRAIKRVFNISSANKKKLGSFKKIEEFARRFGYYGINTERRLDRLYENLNTILELRARREEWYTAAEKEAPSLNFTSPPDKRSVFVTNMNRLDMLSFEFAILCEFAVEQNYELAAVAKKFGPSFGEKLNKIALASLDFLALYPETLLSNLKYFKSVQVLMESLGKERIANLLMGVSKKEFWEQLANEENIKPGSESPYRLFAALWSDGSLKCDGNLKTHNWKQTASFYHNEFNRFLKENEPLRTELMRLEQQLPVVQKTDPRHAVEIDRKICLLKFHTYFQERYIGNMMKEYTLRYALLAIEKPAITKTDLKETTPPLMELRENAISSFYELSMKTAELQTHIKETSNLDERNKLKIRQDISEFSALYYECLSAFLRLAEIRVNHVGETQKKGPKLFGIFRHEGTVSTPFLRPVGLAIDREGEIFALSQEGHYIAVLNRYGKFLRKFGGYGNMPKDFSQPSSLLITSEGELLVSQYSNPALSVLSLEGEFLRLVELEKSSGREPFKMQMDSSGKLYVSFLDGKGLSIFDMNGKLLGSLPLENEAFSSMDKIHGFSIFNDRIFTGGNGKFLVVNIDGTKEKSLESGGIGFGIIISTAVGPGGSFFAVEHKTNRLFRVDSDFCRIETVEDIHTQGLVTVTVKENLMAVSDYLGNAVLFYEIKTP